MTQSPRAPRPPAQASELVLAVQPRLTATYLVACERVPGDLWWRVFRSLPRCAPPELASPVSRQLSSGAVRLGFGSVDDAPALGWDVALCAGDDPDLVERGESARAHVVVQAEGDHRGRRMAHEWSALAVARAVRLACDGVLLDLRARRVLADPPPNGGDPLERVRRGRLASWVAGICSYQADGSLWMTTKGLSRYGLPELSLHGIEPAGAHDALLLLMGTGLWLVRQQARDIREHGPELSLRVVPGQVEVSTRLIRDAYPDGADLGRLRSSVVTLGHTVNDLYGGDPMLEVTGWLQSRLAVAA